MKNQTLGEGWTPSWLDALVPYGFDTEVQSSQVALITLQFEPSNDLVSATSRSVVHY